jgi:hypothetical protein
VSPQTGMLNSAIRYQRSGPASPHRAVRGRPRQRGRDQEGSEAGRETCQLRATAGRTARSQSPQSAGSRPSPKPIRRPGALPGGGQPIGRLRHRPRLRPQVRHRAQTNEPRGDILLPTVGPRARVHRDSGPARVQDLVQPTLKGPASTTTTCSRTDRPARISMPQRYSTAAASVSSSCNSWQRSTLRGARR